MDYMTPIYDRAESDIQALGDLLERGWDNLTNEEKTSWLNNDYKGALNVSDLNRIENNLLVVAELAGIPMTGKTSWAETDIPTISEWERLHDNIVLLRETAPTYSTTPQVPDLPFNTYLKINDIEHIIDDIHNLLIEQ